MEAATPSGRDEWRDRRASDEADARMTERQILAAAEADGESAERMGT